MEDVVCASEISKSILDFGLGRSLWISQLGSLEVSYHGFGQLILQLEFYLYALHFGVSQINLSEPHLELLMTLESLFQASVLKAHILSLTETFEESSDSTCCVFPIQDTLAENTTQGLSKRRWSGSYSTRAAKSLDMSQEHDPSANASRSRGYPARTA